MRQSLHSEPFPRPLLPCHNNDHYHHCVKRGLSYCYINPGRPLLLWSNFCLICGPVLCVTVSCAVTGDHGGLPSFAGLAELVAEEGPTWTTRWNMGPTGASATNFYVQWLKKQVLCLNSTGWSRDIRCFWFQRSWMSRSPNSLSLRFITFLL